MKREENVRIYQTFTDDFVQSKNQDCRIPEDYEWIRTGLLSRIREALVYALAWMFAQFYCRLFLHVKIRNRSVLRGCSGRGYFLYGNHTQPMGDVFLPAVVCGRKHIYTIASQANLGIPVIGRLLPAMGALPLPGDMDQMKKFWDAIFTRIRQKHCVVVYPEAHVWPWYTKIRPFPLTSFHFPVESQAPSFCLTVTYQKRKHGRKPAVTAYVDGPFYPDPSKKKKEQQRQLRDEIHACMEERSRNSTYEYIRYVGGKT